MKSFSQWAGETHYANMKEFVNQIDEIHNQKINELQAAPTSAMDSMKQVASRAGGAASAMKNLGRVADRTGLADRMQNKMSMSNRRNTLKATLQTLGYTDINLLLRDVRSIAKDLGVPGAEVANDQQGMGGNTAADTLTPNNGDMGGMANSGVGANLG